MAKKIKDLTNIISDGTIEKEIKCGIIAMKSDMYEQSWEHLYKAYNSKEATTEEKGEAAYQICNLMKSISANDPLIEKLMKSDRDLIMKAKTKPVTKEYARKYIGRKYLKLGAEYRYSLALIEYGLGCINFGGQDNFVFEYNDDNVEAGLAWANIMKDNDNKYVRQAAHIIYSKYYFVKAINSDDISIINAFGDNVMQAEAIDKNSQYVKFYLGHLMANPKFERYKNGQYYDIKKGYEVFCEASAIASDPLIKRSSTEVKKMLESKFPSKIR